MNINAINTFNDMIKEIKVVSSMLTFEPLFWPSLVVAMMPMSWSAQDVTESDVNHRYVLGRVLDLLNS